MRPLRILHLEPELDRAEYIAAALGAAALSCETLRVATPQEFAEALEAGRFDVILSRHDFSGVATDGFDGLVALKKARVLAPRVPFLFVGAGNDAALVAAMDAGAYDFISTARLVRLAPAIERAVREAGEISEVEKARAQQAAFSDGLRAVLRAADELVACADLDTMLRRAVELAREQLGVERCGLWLLASSGDSVHGTYGTDYWGNTCDERHVIHGIGGWWAKCLTPRRAESPTWFVMEDERHYDYSGGAVVEYDSGWTVGTPLYFEGQAIGVLFNDTARSRAPIDGMVQELLAVYCSFLANLIHSRRTGALLREITSRAPCLLFSAVVEELGNGALRWLQVTVDEASAQRILPLDIVPGVSYGAMWYSSRHPDDVRRMQETVPEQVAIQSGKMAYQQEYRCRDKHGNWHWLLEEVTLHPLPSSAEGFRRFETIGVCTDITERKLSEAQLLHTAFYDGLTDLANRSLFLDRLKGAFQRMHRDGHLFAVLFLDLDGFKKVNDTLGHECGDELLCVVARRFERCLRPGDTAARFGGDEFAILLDNLSDASDATRVAERIQQELHHPVRLEREGHPELQIAASIGIALSRGSSAEAPGYCNSDDIMRDADAAMYCAKSRGSGCHVVFDAAMHSRAYDLSQCETELRRALDEDEFQLVYQPIWEISSGTVCGFEALLRWRHPERGWLEPHSFLEAANDTGVIVPIGDWVLREACRQLASWQRQLANDGLAMRVNCAASQFAQDSWALRVEEALSEFGIKAGQLKIEIADVSWTESLRGRERLGLFERLGVKLSLDDFGTSPAPLSLLQSLPIGELKIDSSFISANKTPGAAIAQPRMVQVVAALAQALGVEVIAEGVETAEQCAELLSYGCTLAQGYHLQRPASAAEISRLLQAIAQT